MTAAEHFSLHRLFFPKSVQFLTKLFDTGHHSAYEPLGRSGGGAAYCSSTISCRTTRLSRSSISLCTSFACVPLFAGYPVSGCKMSIRPRKLGHAFAV